MNLSFDADRLWRAALALNRAAAAVSPHVTNLAPLLFFTDPVRTPRPWEIAARLPVGAGVVYRHFGAPDAADTAARLRAVTHKAGVCLLIGKDAALAQAVAADGVHLPEHDLGRANALKAARPDWIVSGAVHGPTELPFALDALILSPVFISGSSSLDRPALGVAGFTALAARLGKPTYALAGIHAGNASDLAGCGACGIAAVEAIIDAFGP